jgi:hypothetical protein
LPAPSDVWHPPHRNGIGMVLAALEPR